MYALVNAGQIVKLQSANTFIWREMTFSNVNLLSQAERKTFGIFDFVQAQGAPAFHTNGGTTYDINSDQGVVTEVIAYIPWTDERITQEKAAAKVAIDVAADAKRLTYVSPGVYTQQEYMKANTDAKAWLLNTANACPSSVAVWAQAKGWTNQQAADNIVATAAQFDQVLDAIRSIRLLGKAAVEASITGAQVESAKVAVNAQLAQLP